MVVHLQLDFESDKKKLACVHKLAATYSPTLGKGKSLSAKHLRGLARNGWFLLVLLNYDSIAQLKVGCKGEFFVFGGLLVS